MGGWLHWFPEEKKSIPASPLVKDKDTSSLKRNKNSLKQCLKFLMFQNIVFEWMLKDLPFDPDLMNCGQIWHLFIVSNCWNILLGALKDQLSSQYLHGWLPVISSSGMKLLLPGSIISYWWTLAGEKFGLWIISQEWPSTKLLEQLAQKKQFWILLK